MPEEKMTNDVRIANVNSCLAKFKDLLDALPKNDKDPVNVPEILQHKAVAAKALDHLNSIFSPGVQDISIKQPCDVSDLFI